MTRGAGNRSTLLFVKSEVEGAATSRSDARRLAGLRLPDHVIAAMRAELPGCAERVVVAVVGEVPSYSEPFRGRMGRNIENAVALALGGFLDMMATDGPVEEDQGIRVESVFQAAYALGRGEARKIGRATCRERGGEYGWSLGVAG